MRQYHYERRFTAPIPGSSKKLVAFVQFNDKCQNGHNTLTITGEIAGECYGLIHDRIVELIPELQPYLKWHLVSTDGPLYYLANTLYLAKSHGPTHAWVYEKSRVTGAWITAGYYPVDQAKDKAKQFPEASDVKIEIDEKTAKTADYDAARSVAIWPNATDEELASPDLEDKLKARLPALMREFQSAVEELGFEYTEVPIQKARQ